MNDLIPLSNITLHSQNMRESYYSVWPIKILMSPYFTKSSSIMAVMYHMSLF